MGVIYDLSRGKYHIVAGALKKSTETAARPKETANDRRRAGAERTKTTYINRPL